MYSSFRYVLLFITLFIGNVNHVFSQWEQVSSPTFGADIYSITFINDSVGFVGGTPGALYRTDDGGDSWRTFAADSFPNPGTVVSIQFFNDTCGYLMSQRSNASYLYRTFDGGYTWDEIQSVGTGSWGTMDFHNAKFGVIYLNHYFFTTSDSCQTWDTHYKTNSTGLATVDSNTFVYGRGGKSYKSNYAGGNSQCLSKQIATNKISFLNDTLGYAISGNILYKSTNKGQTWTSVFNNGLVGSFYSLYAYNEDTLFAGVKNYVYQSTNGGTVWAKMPSSLDTSTSYDQFNKFSKRTSTTQFVARGGAGVLFKTSNFGGNSLPAVLVKKQSYYGNCFGDTLFIENINDSAGVNYSWWHSGQLISNAYHLNFVVPDTNSLAYLNLYLVAENNLGRDSTSFNVQVYPSSNVKPFVAVLDTLVNCTNNHYRVKVYPYKTSYTYQLIADTTSASYQTISPSFYEGTDTAVYELSLDLSLNHIFKASINNSCGAGVYIDTLDKSNTPYTFTHFPYALKNPVCAYDDTVYWVIPNTKPGTKHWFNAFHTQYQISNPDTIIADADSIVIPFYIPSINSNSLSHHFETEGCVYQTTYFNYIRESVATLSTNSNGAYDALFVGDTIDLTHWTHGYDSICTYNITNVSGGTGDTSIQTCSDTIFKLTDPGTFLVELEMFTNNSCEYAVADSEFIQVRLPVTPNPTLGCAVDTGIYNYRELDFHEDEQGNKYTAGFGLQNMWAVHNAYPVYWFRKFDKDFNLLWEHMLTPSNRIQNTSDYQASYGNCITTDAFGNVYVGGSMEYNYFQFDSFSYTGHNGPTQGGQNYAYVAKLDSLGVMQWVKFFDSNESTTWSYPNAITDMVYVNGRIFMTADLTHSGQFYKNDGNWDETVEESGGTYQLIEMDTADGAFINRIPLGNRIPSYNNWIYQGGAYGYGNSTNSCLALDKQNRIKVLFNVKAGWDNTITLNNLVINGVTGGTSYEVLATYDPVFGWIDATIPLRRLDDFGRREYQINNTLQFDNHGNKYLISNWGRGYRLAEYYNGYYYDGSSYTWGSTYNHRAGAMVSKLDAQNNLLWNRRFYDCHLADMLLSDDESHLGLSFLTQGKFSYINESGVIIGEEYDDYMRKQVYVQLSSTGEMEKNYPFGAFNSVPKYMFKSDSGYFKLMSTIRQSPDSLVIMNSDTINLAGGFNGYGGTTVTTFGGEDDQCLGEAFPGELADTLFVYTPPMLALCETANIPVLWVATEAITTVNLGYYIDTSSTKIYIANNLQANLYGTAWEVPQGVVGDSIQFFIESTDFTFYNESDFSELLHQPNFITIEDTTLCLGDTLSLSTLENEYTFNWLPNNLFTDPSENQQQVQLSQSDTIILVATTGGCTFSDSVSVTINTIIPAAYNTSLGGDTLHLVSQTTADSILWIVDNSSLGGNDSISLILTSGSSYAVCQIAFSACGIDTLCQVQDIPYRKDSAIIICGGDSAFLQNNYQITTGFYYDTLVAVNGIDSIISTQLTVNSSYITYDSLEICFGDSIEIFGQYRDTSATYIDSLQTIKGCDSINIAVLNVIPVIHYFDTTNLSCGDSTYFNGMYLSSAGAYYKTLAGIKGCDSISHMEIVVAAAAVTFNGTINTVQLCERDTVSIQVNPEQVTEECSSIDNVLFAIPDGVGTTYQVDINVTCGLGTIIGSNNSIDNIWLQLEHSWVGDLDITIECPNGQQMNIIEYPSSLSGNNFGEPIPDDNGVPGLGYNYYINENNFSETFENSPTVPVTYIDQQGFAQTGDTYPAGDYAPEQSLSLLDGCPVDGEWTLLITDNLAADDGFMHSWGLNFANGSNSNSIPIDGDWTGNNIISFNDSTMNATPNVSSSFVYSVVDNQGCSHDTTFVVNVTEVDSVFESVQICIGDSVLLAGDYQNTSGTYYDVFQNQLLCDSIKATTLTVIQNINEVDTISICIGDSVYLQGAYQYVSGIYTDTLVSVSSCDTVITTHLQVGNNIIKNIMTSICSGDSIYLQGEYQTSGGIYNDTITVAGSCDSVITTNLTVEEPISSTDSITICLGDSIFLQQGYQNTTGTYYDTLQTIEGCDSVLITSLAIQQPILVSDNASICIGDSLFLQNAYQTQQGVYQDTLQTVLGCDSVVFINLSIDSLNYLSLDLSICEGDSVFLEGKYQHSNGQFIDTVAGAFCDTVVSTNLVVHSPILTQNLAGICEGDSIYLQNGYQTNVGIYYDTLSSQLGCDSIIETELVLNSVTTIQQTFDICEGDSILINGVYYNSQGLIKDTLFSAQGCDSIVESVINIHLAVTNSLDMETCEGDSVLIFNQYQNVAGLYIDTLQTSLGCDSIIEISLSTLNNYYTLVSETICAGDSLLIGGNYHSIAGVYPAFLQSVAGCDSTIEVNLSVTAIDTTITQLGDSLIAVSGYDGYQWINCDNQLPVTGETAHILQSDTNGVFALEIMDENCVANTQCYPIVIGMLENELGNSLMVYPNPTINKVFISFENMSNNTTIELFNVEGKKLLEEQPSANNHNISLKNFARGVYMLKIISQDKVATIRLVKQE